MKCQSKIEEIDEDDMARGELQDIFLTIFLTKSKSRENIRNLKIA